MQDWSIQFQGQNCEQEIPFCLMFREGIGFWAMCLTFYISIKVRQRNIWNIVPAENGLATPWDMMIKYDPTLENIRTQEFWPGQSNGYNPNFVIVVTFQNNN